MQMSSDLTLNSGNYLQGTGLTPQQQEAITALYENNLLLVAPLGGGKTIIAATAITELLEDGIVDRVLIVTTPKIAKSVWRQEFHKWSHTKNIQIVCAAGDPKQREKAIKSSAQVVVITFNTLVWMKENGLFKGFNGLLIDETTKLKSSSSAGFKALKGSLKGFIWRAGLTGTPVSEDFLGLYSQIYCIDNGLRLGKSKTRFKETYFFPTDYNRYKWELKKGSAEAIMDKLREVIYVVPDYRDSLPPIEYKTITYEMEEWQKGYYKLMNNDMVTEHASSVNAAVLVQKLTQIASGFVYDDDGEVFPLSDKRIKVVKDFIQTHHPNDNILLFYWYKEDKERLLRHLDGSEDMSGKYTESKITRWNKGEIKILLAHPKSAAHGIRLEKGGNIIIWLTPQYSNDLFQQANARLWRYGQEKKVIVYTVIAKDTVDELPLSRIEDKKIYNELFLQHLSS